MEITMLQTGWLSLLPPLLAITLALITKEVYSSLFAGLISGMLIYTFHSGESVIRAAQYIFDMIAAKISANSYMIVFLAMLWAVVVVITKSGGTLAYASWVKKRLKSARSTQIATALLGLVIFIDDGFNCLTVGTIMRPVFDSYKLPREKLAYLIDATAAPVCIIAPVSSWAVAVASEVSETDGFLMFLQTIPFNLYALLTLTMVFTVTIRDMDFGPMKEVMVQAACAGQRSDAADQLGDASAMKNGRVYDLLLPLGVLVVTAILGMAYVGGFFAGVPFSQAIGENPTAGLTLGAFTGLLVAFVLYLPRKLMTFTEFMDSIVQGVKNIVPPMLILILSWALSGVCREMIGTGIFVSSFVNRFAMMLPLLPFIVFIIAAFLSFSMGTAWGTFGILIPIVTMICHGSAAGGELLIPALGATLAGSVYGDHSSPVSDTTILASTGAACDHMSHVRTQLPYATLVAGVCGVGYLIAGFTRSALITVPVSLVLLLAILFVKGRSTGETPA